MKVKVHLSIEPNIGLGSVTFGSTCKKVMNELGTADHVDSEAIHMGMAKGWYYDNLNLDVFFHTGERATETWVPGSPHRVVLFTTSSNLFLLWGRNIIGQSESKVLQLFKSQGHASFTVIDNNSASGVTNGLKGLRFSELNLDMHFDKKCLRQVQWGVPMQELPYGCRFPP